MPYSNAPPSVLIAATSTASEAFFFGTGRSALASSWPSPLGRRGGQRLRSRRARGGFPSDEKPYGGRVGRPTRGSGLQRVPECRLRYVGQNGDLRLGRAARVRGRASRRGGRRRLWHPERWRGPLTTRPSRSNSRTASAGR